MYQNDAQKCLTGEVRLSYANLVTPRAPQNGQGEPKYSVTLLIPKADLSAKADIDGAINAAIWDAIGSKWNGVQPPVIAVPVYDGDGVRANGEPFGEECKGHWVVTASSKNKPQVVGQDNINVQLAPSDIYSGMYARVTIRFFGYVNSGKKGIGCGLGNVMKTRDGEPLSGGASAATDFASVGNSVAQQPVQSYAQPVRNYGAPVGQPTAQPVRINPITGQPM